MKINFAFLGLSTVFALFLLGLRVVETNTLKYIFLAWNLVLAWMPIFMALLLKEVSKDLRFRWPHLFILGGWLLFLPNAPYLITDLLHLRPREGAPFWFDVCLVGIFAWNGIATGLASTRIIHLYLIRNVGKWKSAILITLCFMLCGFGVYLGRVERWNSWDILSDPLALLNNITDLILNPFEHPGMLGMSSIFFLFLSLAYFSTHGVHLSLKNTAHEKNRIEF
ncbi:MAG: DUF1361 domain-containing protein [Bacteroidia bacterium]|nr:DUF1361 domain-containing protein [Bacteroidia bacterium]